MSRIRSKDTTPEIIVRKMLHNYGIRYRLYTKGLPGKPDLSNKSKKFAVFVNGCFWHQHAGCKRASTPKSNQEYWYNKLKNNVSRLSGNISKLEKSGYKVFTIWECEVKNNKAIDRLIDGIKLCD